MFTNDLPRVFVLEPQKGYGGHQQLWTAFIPNCGVRIVVIHLCTSANSSMLFIQLPINYFTSFSTKSITTDRYRTCCEKKFRIRFIAHFSSCTSTVATSQFVEHHTLHSYARHLKPCRSYGCSAALSQRIQVLALATWIWARSDILMSYLSSTIFLIFLSDFLLI